MLFRSANFGSSKGVLIDTEASLGITSSGWNVLFVKDTFSLEVEAGFGSSKNVIINTTTPIDIGVYNYSFGKSYSVVTLPLNTGLTNSKDIERPDVELLYNVVGENVNWSIEVYNPNNARMEILYSGGATGTFTSGGYVEAFSSKIIPNYRKTQRSQSVNMNVYVKLLNSFNVESGVRRDRKSVV